MRTFAQRKNQPQEQETFSVARPNLDVARPNHREHLILRLQQGVGNQAVQRMLHTNNESLAGLQSKLRVNEPGDIYEKEADRMADQVLAAPAHSAVISTPPRIQRFSGPSAAQAAGRSNEPMNPAPAGVEQVLTSPGNQLEPALRQDMEQRFGDDFSDVRVHTDNKAADSARALKSLAYTVGSNIVFGNAQFAPSTSKGKKLLAHELTHVVQQRDSSVAIQRAPVPEVELARMELAEALADLERTSQTDDEKAGPVSSDGPLVPGDPRLCGSPKCFTDEDIYGEYYAYKKREEAEANELLEQQRRGDEGMHARLMTLLELLVKHGLRKSEIIEELTDLPPRDRQVLTRYGLKMPGFWTKQIDFQQHVRDVLIKYDAEWRKENFGAGPRMKAMTEEDAKAFEEQQRQKEFVTAWLEGLPHVTGSFLGALGAQVTSIFTDDPRKIAAGAKLGTALGGVTGSFATARSNAGSYSPDVVGEIASPVGSWRYGKPAIVDAPTRTKAPKSEGPPNAPKVKDVKTPTEPAALKPPKPKRPGKQTKAQKQQKSAETLDNRIERVRNELAESKLRTLEYKDVRASQGKSEKGGPIKGMWNKYEELYVLERARAHPDRIIIEQPRLIGIKAPNGKIRPTTDIVEEGRTVDFLEIDGTKVLGAELKSQAEIVGSVSGLKSPGLTGDFRSTSKVGEQRGREQIIIEEAIANGSNLVFKGKDIRTGENFTKEIGPNDYRSTVVSYDQLAPN
jgi:hypothetical protein